MADIKIPELGESVSEATIANWLKKEGEAVQADETILELETDKVTLEVNAPAAGVLTDLKTKAGDTVTVGQVVGQVDEKAKPSAASKAPGKREEKPVAKAPEKPAPQKKGETGDLPLSPTVKRLTEEHKIDPAKIEGSGKDGRILADDVLKAMGGKDEPTPVREAQTEPVKPAPQQAASSTETADRERRVPMTRLRQTIAQRLKSAQETAAILTTFNEVDMSHIMALRNEMKDAFQKRHGVKLGFMSFFVKACVTALKEVPEVNSEIQGTDIVYKDHYDIAVAVGTDKGLVVPVIRDADKKSFAEVEAEIGRMAQKARDGTLSMADMTGGTFSISNGGVYGSMMSTPILNPPQSGILGMHNIQKRPVVVGENIRIRPMMYLALSYDHRIVDGKGAVTFLLRVKQCIEKPERILLEA